MKNDFYVDKISKTIISSLSNEIAANTKKEINTYIKDFLKNEYSVHITDKIKDEVNHIEKTLSGAEKKTAKQADASLKEMKIYIEEALSKHLGSGDKQIDSLREELAALRADINENKKLQSEHLSRTIENSLAGHSAKIEKSIGGMKKELSETGEIKAILEGNGKKIEKHIAEIGKGLISAGTQETLLKKELGDIKKTVTDQITEKQAMTNVAIEKHLLGQTGKIEEYIGEMKKELSEQGKLDDTVKGEFIKLRKYFEGLASDLKSGGDESSLIINELTNVKKDLKESGGKQNALMIELVKDHLIGIIEKVYGSVEEIRGGMNNASEIREIMEDSNRSVEKYIKNMAAGLKVEDNNNKELLEDIDDVKKQLEDNKKEQHELLNGVYYSVKKLLAENSRDESISHFESSLDVVRNQIKDNTDRQLKMEDEYHEKISGQLLNGIRDVKEYMDGAITASFNKQDSENSAQEELAELRKEMDATEKEQTKLLNGVFFSIKKLTSAHTKEKQDAADLMTQFRSMLDSLNAHVRRLEAEKDELSVELLRLAGDDFFQNKFAELEKELKKTRNVADEYLKEKMELEGKLKAFQHLWEKSATKN